MERATLAEGRQDGMARVRAGAARTNAAGGGGGATVLVVERAALGVALLSFGEEGVAEASEVLARRQR